MINPREGGSPNECGSDMNKRQVDVELGAVWMHDDRATCDGSCDNPERENLPTAGLDNALGAQIADIIAPYHARMTEALAVVSKLKNPLEDKLEEALPGFRDFLIDFMSVDIKSRLEFFETFPRSHQKALLRASQKGWFFGWENSVQDIRGLVAEVNSSGDGRLDDIFIKHYQSRVEEFGRSLTVTHPNRAQAISAAVSAHQRGGPDDFYLSIPVFLAQADGILYDMSSLKSPLSSQRKDRDKSNVETFLDDIERPSAMMYGALAPLRNLPRNPLFMSEREREQMAKDSKTVFSSLNRHLVLHGISNDYGNEVNSLKAFSFLAFVGLHLPEYLNSPE